MGEVTLKVPAEYAEDFRMALVEEMATDIRSLKSNQEERAELCERGKEVDPRGDDVSASLGLLKCDAALMEQVDMTAVDGFEIRTADVATLASACETMAREEIAPKLTHLVSCTPVDAHAAEEIRPLMERLAWAVERAAELHSEWAAQPDELKWPKAVA